MDGIDEDAPDSELEWSLRRKIQKSFEKLFKKKTVRYVVQIVRGGVNCCPDFGFL